MTGRLSGRRGTPSPGGRSWRAGRRWPAAVTIAGRRFDRHAYLHWWVRAPLWAAAATVGWLAAGWVGVAVGLLAAGAAEVAFSYRPPARGAAPVPGARPARGPGGEAAGVREPRRPAPSGGSGAAAAIPHDDPPTPL